MLPPCFPLLPPLSRMILADGFRMHDFLLRMWWGGEGATRWRRGVASYRRGSGKALRETGDWECGRKGEP